MFIKYLKFDYITNEHLLDNPYSDINHKYSSNEFTFISRCNFYKLFWIFMIGSIFGCYLEQIQYYINKSIWESRAGVIWGPFSEIYGLGAVLMFLLYLRIQNTSPLTIFCTAFILGSAFEYYANLFQEKVLDSSTWNYSKQPFNIGGRTSLKYGIYWGLLGLVFIKWIYPQVSKILEQMKGKLAFTCTWFLIVFMSFNLLFSALAVNRWDERTQNTPPAGHIDEFLDSYYGNETMKYIFPHMKFLDTTGKTT